MANKKDFGERNKNLSEKLYQEKTYYDWSITTAFYSSIHFVEDFIFPTEIDSITCDNISDAKTAYKINGRHATREKLVFDKINCNVGARYKWLDDNSRNARYKTYKIRPEMAEKAMSYLKYIYDSCYPKTEETPDLADL